MGSRKKWYVDRGGERSGPYSNAEIRDKVRRGEVLAHHLLWKEGLRRWMPAGESKKLFLVTERERATGPSLRLLILAALAALLAVMCSPWSELTQGLPGVVQVGLTVISFICIVTALSLTIFGLIGGIKPAVVVAIGAVRPQTETVQCQDAGRDDDGTQEGAAGLSPGGTVAESARRRTGLIGTAAARNVLLALSGNARVLLASGFVLALSAFVAIRYMQPSLRISSRYSVRDLNGSVVYDDGTLIQGVPLMLMFTSVRVVSESATAPPGIAMLDPRTGRFKAKMVYATAATSEGERLRVTVRTPVDEPLPPTIIPAEYCDPTRTPLEVDANEPSLTITVKRPGVSP